MSEKMDRQGARTAAQLEQKYQFGKQFQEIMGIVEDVRKYAYAVESGLNSSVAEAYTKLIRSADEMIFEALKVYTQKSELDEITKTLRSEMSASAEGIKGLVSAVDEKVQKVDGDLQTKYNLITKYFTFDINGLLIGAIDEDGKPSPNKVVIDNDEITIIVKDSPVMTFKADGTASIPQLTVTKSMTILGLAVTEDETHINIDYLG